MNKDLGTCRNCGRHRGTVRWVGEGGVLALTHGGWAPWCECCCLKEQLKYAKKLAAKIPQLEKQLAKVTCESVLQPVASDQ